MAIATSKPSQLSEERVEDSDDGADITSSASESETREPGQDLVDDSSLDRAGSEPSSDGSSSESGDDDDNDSGSAASNHSRSKKRLYQDTLNQRERASKKQRPSSMKIPAKPFRPPPGYDPLSIANNSVNEEAVQAFSETDGKQVWHITAPSSVDLSQIRSFDIAAALRNETIHTTNGIGYGLQPLADQAEVLLLPGGDPIVYKQARSKVTRSFQLRQVKTSEAEDDNGTSPQTEARTGLHFTAQKAGKGRPPRQQPSQLLNYRYVPFGVAKDQQEEETRLAESILVHAASQGEAMEGVEQDVIDKPSTKKDKKKRKKAKLTDEPSI